MQRDLTCQTTGPLCCDESHRIRCGIGRGLLVRFTREKTKVEVDLIPTHDRVGYAVTFWDDPHGEHVGWRFSLAVQFIPALIFAVGLPFLPETYVLGIQAAHMIFKMNLT